MITTNIYALYDSRDPQLVPMYVGKGSQKRAEFHWKFFLRKGQAVNALLRRWFERLRAEGIEPAWKFLEENVENWQEAEKKWVALMRVVNPNLCNVAEGGNAWPQENSAIYRECKIRAGRIGGKIGGPSGGKIVGLQNAQLGRLKLIGKVGGIVGAPRSNHSRWHLKRNRLNPLCQLCRPNFINLWESSRA